MSAAKNAAWEKKASREKELVHNVAQFTVGLEADVKGVEFIKVGFYFKPSEVLVVSNAVNEDGARVVSFTSGDDLWAALLKWCRLTQQGQHKWREDKGRDR